MSYSWATCQPVTVSMPRGDHANASAFELELELELEHCLRDLDELLRVREIAAEQFDDSIDVTIEHSKAFLGVRNGEQHPGSRQTLGHRSTK